MPNNLVFNDSAENLKVQSFGATSGGTVTSLLVANDGTLQIGGNVTATIANTVTVTGQVSVTAIDFDIRSLSAATDTVSIAGSITATIANTVTVTGQVSVTAIDFDIRSLSAATDTVSVTGSVTATIAGTVAVSVAGYGFTTSNLNISLVNASLTHTAFLFDTSQMKQYSFYVMNTGAAAISVRLQVSPTTTEAFFTPDKSSEVSLMQNQSAVFVPAYFLNYTRIRARSTETAAAVAYFNGQN